MRPEHFQGYEQPLLNYIRLFAAKKLNSTIIHDLFLSALACTVLSLWELTAAARRDDEWNQEIFSSQVMDAGEFVRMRADLKLCYDCEEPSSLAGRPLVHPDVYTHQKNWCISKDGVAVAVPPDMAFVLSMNNMEKTYDCPEAAFFRDPVSPELVLLAIHKYATNKLGSALLFLCAALPTIPNCSFACASHLVRKLQLSGLKPQGLNITPVSGDVVITLK